MNTIKHILHLIFVVFLFLFSFSVNAIEYAHFDHYDETNGLSANRVFCMTQDSFGFIWVGTNFGLERFDGYSFKHFQVSDYPDMKKNDIRCLFSSKNKIEIGGTNGVLIKYNPQRDEFVNIQPDDFNETYYKEIRGFFQKEGEPRYVYTIGGIYRYNGDTDRYENSFPAYTSMQSIYVRTMYIDEYQRYWIGSVDCFYVFDRHGKLIRKFDSSFGTCNFFTRILPAGKDKLLVSSLSNKLWIFDMDSLTVNDPKIIETPFENTSDILHDSYGRYWFATDGCGLWYSDSPLFRPSDFKTLSPYGCDNDEIKKIYTIIEDKKGAIWIGTYNTGLWRYKRKKNSDLTFSTEIGMPKFVCSSFEEADNGDIIIASDGSGIFQYSSKNNNIKQYRFDNNNITSLTKRSDGGFWVLSWGTGIYQFNPETGASRIESFKGVKDPINCYFSIKELSNGEVWASTASDGIYVRDLSKQWRRFILQNEKYPNSDAWVYQTVEGKNNDRWVLTTNKLWRINGTELIALLPDNFKEKTYNPLSVSDAVCDAGGNLFVATNVGIMRFEANDTTFQTLSFLPKADYHSICRDRNGLFWISGSNGIISFDYDKKMYHYLPGDFSSAEKKFFTYRSIFQDSKGILYFGTNTGFYMFDPQLVSTDSVIPHLAFSDLYIAREKVKPFSSVLEKGNLSSLDNLELSYGQTDISIKLDVIDYNLFNHVRCKYRLAGLHKDWIDLEKERKIDFNYIPTGSYVLEVMAYRPNVPSSKQIITKNIVVLPPWWATWWFRLSLVILLVLLVSFFVWQRFRRLLKQKSLLQEKVDERTSDLKKALCDKDRLISVIAHDLKNPMFAVVGALENWLNKENEMSNDLKRNLIRDVLSSAQSLQREMLKLLDWAKSKRDSIVCHPSDVDVKFMVGNVLLLLQGMMDDKQIRLLQKFDFVNYACADSRMISAVVRNLLSNSIKFTPRQGEIVIKGWQTDNLIYLEISDTGIGMDNQQLENLLYTQQYETTLGTEKERGTGLGFRICQDYMLQNNGTMQVKSEKGKGTSITLILPMSDRLLNENSEQKINQVTFEVNQELLEGNTILLVDDDPLICSNLKSILETYVNVIVANNGKEALEMALKFIPDVIISDVEMPELNGIEMSIQLDKNATVCHIPILFISAKNEESDRLIGLLSGAVDYISKPFSSTELLLKVSNILNVRQKQQQRILNEWIGTEKKKVKADTPKVKQEEKINPFLECFLEVLSRKYSENQLSMDDLAVEMCMSLSTLNRRARSLTGKTPLEILNEYRLNQALTRLRNNSSQVTVSDIAYEVGFSDPSYFTKKFREYFGYPPSKIII